jgi:hypothetical protein
MTYAQTFAETRIQAPDRSAREPDRNLRNDLKHLGVYFVTTFDNSPHPATFQLFVNRSGVQFVSKSTEDNAYLALRRLLNVRVMSPDTRRQVSRALREVHKDAMKRSLLQTVFEEDTTASAGD